MKIAALAMSLGLAVITVIFTLFMGCKSGRLIHNAGTMRQDINLFYYFGDAWKEIDSLPEMADTYNATVYIRIILGLLIYVATLVTVTVLSIMSVVRNVKVITKQGDRAGIKHSLTAFFIFVAGAMGLFFIHSMSVNIDASYGTSIPKEVFKALEEYNSKLNGSTIAGFVLGSVFLVLMTVFSLLSEEKKRFNARYIMNLSLSLVKIAFLAVLTAMFIRPFTTATVTYFSEYEAFDVTIGYGPFSLFGNAASLVESEIDNAQIVMTLAAIGFVFACGTLAIGFMSVSGEIREVFLNEENDNERKAKQFNASLAATIVLVVISAISLTLNVIANDFFSEILTNEYLPDENLFSFSYVTPIVMLLMSVFALGVEIARLITNKRNETLTLQ